MIRIDISLDFGFSLGALMFGQSQMEQNGQRRRGLGRGVGLSGALTLPLCLKGTPNSTTLWQTYKKLLKME